MLLDPEFHVHSESDIGSDTKCLSKSKSFSENFYILPCSALPFDKIENFFGTASHSIRPMTFERYSQIMVSLFLRESI